MDNHTTTYTDTVTPLDGGGGEEEVTKPSATDPAEQAEGAANAKPAPTTTTTGVTQENDAVLDSVAAMLSLEKAGQDDSNNNNHANNDYDEQSTAKKAPPKPAPTPEPEAATPPVLVRGGALPPISKESHIPYLKENNNERLKPAYVHYLLEEIPEDLQDIDSERWKDGKYLIQTFYVYNKNNGKRQRAKLQFPPCLLFTAKTLLDRLTVINFWLSNSREKQTQMIRDREEGLLKYYMQLKDTRENIFRQAFYSGNPLQQKKKAEQQKNAAHVHDEHYNNTINSMNMNFFQPPIVPRHVNEKRVVMADETSTCLDYMLRTNILCIPCDQFRQRFLPPPHRTFVDVWPLYKARRKEIVENETINTNQQYTCLQLFDVTKDVGRGTGHKKRTVLKFIEEHRMVQKSPSLIEYERKRLAKPCFGLSGDGVRSLILQASEQANRLAVLKDDVIPESFPLPDCYHNRVGFANVIVRKEERMVKVYSRKRNRKTAASKKNDAEADTETQAEDVEPEQAKDATSETAANAANPTDTTNAAEGGQSKYHYVIRSNACAGSVDTQKGHKLCKACTDAAVMVRSVARDAAKELNLTKGAALTKLDVAKLITSPELIESTIKMLRQQRAKDMKMCRKELQRLRDRSGIQKQVRRKDASVAAAAPLEQPQALVEQQQQHDHHPHYAMPPLPVNGYRRYGYHEEEDDEEDEQQLHHGDDIYAMNMHARALPQRVPAAQKRPRHQY